MIKSNFVAVALPRFVYVGIAKREEFDRLDLPVSDCQESGGNPVLVKSMVDAGVTVVFQHWYGPTTTEHVDQAEQKVNTMLEAML